MHTHEKEAKEPREEGSDKYTSRQLDKASEEDLAKFYNALKNLTTKPRNLDKSCAGSPKFFKPKQPGTSSTTSTEQSAQGQNPVKRGHH